MKKHCLIMSFIGKDGYPAVKLKDANLKPPDALTAYNQVIKV